MERLFCSGAQCTGRMLIARPEALGWRQRNTAAGWRFNAPTEPAAGRHAMPAQSPCRHALRLLKDKIARTRARVRCLETAMKQQSHKPVFVIEARLTAAKLRLARLCIERQRLRAELQA